MADSSILQAAMPSRAQPHSIIKLHNYGERCWGVVNERGALLSFNGLSMQLTRAEAQIIADGRNRKAPRTAIDCRTRPTIGA